MLELNATSFLGAITELGKLIILIKNDDQAALVSSDIRRNILAPHVGRLVEELTRLNARSALASVNRLRLRIDNLTYSLTFGELRTNLNDIESRFADHLADIKLFVLNEHEASLFESADSMLGFAGSAVEGFSRAYPHASFEIEEAGKCIALGRHTACVFHCMRVLEHGIKAMCKFLEIPDATKPAEKNWGVILKTIKGRIDELYPAQTRLPNSPGASLENLYATLDIIKNPWRNATMHVENVYAPHEALHVARCTGMFMIALLKHCDEQGIPLQKSPASATVSAPTDSPNPSEVSST